MKKEYIAPAVSAVEIQSSSVICQSKVKSVRGNLPDPIYLPESDEGYEGGVR